MLKDLLVPIPVREPSVLGKVRLDEQVRVGDGYIGAAVCHQAEDDHLKNAGRLRESTARKRVEAGDHELAQGPGRRPMEQLGGRSELSSGGNGDAKQP